MKEVLKLENVTKKYKDKTVVDNLSLNIDKGEVFALLGANGAGKTTTIKMILGLAKVSSGNIEIEEGTKIGYSPETPYFPPYLTAMEVMKYYAGIEGDKTKKDKGYLKSLLDITGLEDTKIKVKNYSKGMIQRLALAQALISDPDILPGIPQQDHARWMSRQPDLMHLEESTIWNFFGSLRKRERRSSSIPTSFTISKQSATEA